MSEHLASSPSKNVPSRGPVIAAGIVFALVILGGISALIYFFVIAPGQKKSDESSSLPSNDNALRVGDFVYLARDLDSGETQWLSMSPNTLTTFVSQQSRATKIQLVANPELKPEFVPNTGDVILHQSCGLADLGDGTEEAVGKISLRVPEQDAYLHDVPGQTDSCIFTAASSNTPSAASGFAFIALDATGAGSDYQWVSKYGNPPTNSEIQSGTTGTTYPEQGQVEQNVKFRIRPSYHLSKSQSTNFCGGHPLTALTNADSTIVPGYTSSAIPTEFYFVKA